MFVYSFTHNINAKELFELNESARRHNIRINYLGSHLKRFRTTFEKVNLLYDQLCQLDDNEIVCAVDGFDVLFCGNADEIKQRFLSFKCDCVVSVERAYSQQSRKYKNYFDKIHCESPYRYINSGSIIGYAGALRKIYAPTLYSIVLPKIFTGRVLRKIKNISWTVKRRFNLKNFNANYPHSSLYYGDQKHVGRYVATNSGNLNIKLDHDTKIFWCTAWEWKDIDNHFRVEDAKIINNHTNSDPLIIHVPGWRVYRDVLTKLFKVQQSLGKQGIMDQNWKE